MKRQDGYYWVKDPNTFEWMIAEWDKDHGWFVCGVEYSVDDDWADIGDLLECPYIY